MAVNDACEKVPLNRDYEGKSSIAEAATTLDLIATTSTRMVSVT